MSVIKCALTTLKFRHFSALSIHILSIFLQTFLFIFIVSTFSELLIVEIDFIRGAKKNITIDS